jgi:hypothetical protein
MKLALLATITMMVALTPQISEKTSRLRVKGGAIVNEFKQKNGKSMRYF